MFVKKLVEKASKVTLKQQPQHAGDGIRGLREEDVHPCLTFHYGVPSGATTMAYDPIHHILAISAKDGRIKLVGKDNTQTLLQSEFAVPSKFLQFLDNQGILLNVTLQNHIEVWNIEKRQLCYLHIFEEEITSFVAVQHSSYMYVGDSLGNISVLKFDREIQHLVAMQYTIPSSESHGTIEVHEDTAVMYTLPQPLAESKRILIIFKDGHLCLWGIQECKVIFIAGGSLQHSSLNEPKKVLSACWVCPNGSKVAVGYSNGEIFLWAIPVISDQKTGPVTNKKDLPASCNIPLFKLNLGYKMDKIPIVCLRWVVGDGRASRLYVNGFSDLVSSHSFQVIILNESSESRTIKMVLPLTEACLAMENISLFDNRNKSMQNALVLLLKSGRLCLYEESEIEHYLSQCQSKSPPSLPNQFMVNLPFGDLSLTISKLYTGNSASSSHLDEDLALSSKYSCLLSLNRKDGNHISSTPFSGFTKIKNMYITGHADGTINFWDASCPLLNLILSIEQQTDEANYSSGSPVTALHFDMSSQILISGDQNGTVHIITFKKEQTASENILSFLHAKQGNYTIQNVKLKGSILSITIKPGSKHLAIGTDKGFVALIDMETTNILYQKQFPSQLYTGIISLQFENCHVDGYEKDVLLVGMEDSSVLAIEEDTGNALNASGVHTKKPSRALFMQTLGSSPYGAHVSYSQDMRNENPSNESLPKQSLLLLCSENAVRLYSLSHAAQGIKKLYGKKKLSGTCCCASLVYSPSSDVGLMLIFVSGKIEIRSLPDLALLKEAFLRGFMYPMAKSRPNFSGALCASSEGELVAVNGDKEICFFSIFPQKAVYRNIEYINHVYNKDMVHTQEALSYVTNVQKEKKKGLFGMVVKDFKGNKLKHGQEINLGDSSANIEEELSLTFSTANFPLDVGRRNNSVKTEEDVELDIDDIELEDSNEKPKGQSFSILNKQKFGKKLLAIKGKLKLKTDEKANLGKEKQEDENAVGSIDQIKKKYGYSVSSDSSAAKMAERKLNENVKKLEDIGVRSSEMQNTAQSFSAMAKELLRNAQK